MTTIRSTVTGRNFDKLFARPILTRITINRRNRALDITKSILTIEMENIPYAAAAMSMGRKAGSGKTLTASDVFSTELFD